MRTLAVITALSLASIAAHAESTVPFQAAIDTEVAVTGPCGATCLNLSISGTGTGSHLGRLSIEGPSQINFATMQQTGTSTLTGADGSAIVISFSGTFVPGAGPGDATFHGTFTVTVGSGRFAGASGSGTYHGSASGDTGVLYLDGSLSSPGRKP